MMPKMKGMFNGGTLNNSNISNGQSANLGKTFEELKNIGNLGSVDRSQNSSMKFLANQINPQINSNYNSIEQPFVRGTMGKGFWGSSVGASNDLSQSNLDTNMSKIAASQNYADEQQRQALNEQRLGRKLGTLQAAGNTSLGQTFDIVKQPSTLDKLAQLAGATAGALGAYKAITG